MKTIDSPVVRLEAAAPLREAARPDVSIVVPVYNGGSTIGSLCEQLKEAFAPRGTFEVVLVNDGSQDESEQVCRLLAHTHPWVRFVNLARNFGEHNAVLAGLRYCTGSCAVIMDDDLQHPPSEAVKLVDRLDQGHDVVFSYYDVKRHSWPRNAGSFFNNALATVLLKKPYRLYLSSFKAINRLLIDEVTRYRGPYPYIDGLILRATQRYATELVQHEARSVGRSNYTVGRLFGLYLNMFTSFSVLPLRIASFAGLFFASAGTILAALVAYEKLADPTIPIGWASITVAVLLTSGVQLFALGMIGEYLGRLFLNAVETPQFVVRDTVNCGADEP